MTQSPEGPLMTQSGHRYVNCFSPPHQFIVAGGSERLIDIEFVF